MNMIQAKSDWKKKKLKLQSISSELTDNVLYYEKGKEDELIERVQKRLHISKKGARDLINAA